ncbi:hypothetical protein ACQUQU_04115 [Thalassolituus sp. LLYu03]|uniref:hypothetical protein n=1 Tax=Thalassolituus sp. LLYu03 TaxID=3421656 RepID=UPI003D27CF47
MSAIGLVIAIALPVALALFGLVFAGRKQQAKDSQRAQARLVRQSADDLLEALEFLILVDNFKEVQFVILDRVDHLYGLYQEGLPKGDSDASGVPFFDPEPYRGKIEAGKGSRRIFKSDRELRLARRMFGRVLKTLAVLVKKKVISETAMLEYRRYLRLTLLEREVDTYTAQGDVAAGRGDVITATNYYKAAKKLLIEFDLQYPEKNERIRALSSRTASLYNGGQEREDNLAKALSKEAEPETDVFGIPSNPTEKRKY